MYVPAITPELCKDAAAAESWAKNLVTRLQEREGDGSSYAYSIVEDRERQLFVPKVIIRQHGIDNEYVLHYDFITSIDYGRIVELGTAIRDLIEEGGYVRRGEKIKPVESFVEALEWLMAESKRGLYIQRYKGLGEMNPGAVMGNHHGSEYRRMLRVTIEDAIGADQLFNTLMV